MARYFEMQVMERKQQHGDSAILLPSTVRQLMDGHGIRTVTGLKQTSCDAMLFRVLVPAENFPAFSPSVA